jgi:hypothetical protein
MKQKLSLVLNSSQIINWFLAQSSQWKLVDTITCENQSESQVGESVLLLQMFFEELNRFS